MPTFDTELPSVKVALTEVIDNYSALQSKLVGQVNALAAETNTAEPGKFLEVQFQMAQVSQIGDTISTMVSQANQVIGKTIQAMAR